MPSYILIKYNLSQTISSRYSLSDCSLTLNPSGIPLPSQQGPAVQGSFEHPWARSSIPCRKHQVQGARARRYESAALRNEKHSCSSAQAGAAPPARPRKAGAGRARAAHAARYESAALRSRKHSCSSAHVGAAPPARPVIPYSYRMPSAVATTTLTAFPSPSPPAPPERARLAAWIAQIAGTPCAHHFPCSRTPHMLAPPRAGTGPMVRQAAARAAQTALLCTARYHTGHPCTLGLLHQHGCTDLTRCCHARLIWHLH